MKLNYNIIKRYLINKRNNLYIINKIFKNLY